MKRCSLICALAISLPGFGGQLPHAHAAGCSGVLPRSAFPRPMLSWSMERGRDGSVNQTARYVWGEVNIGTSTLASIGAAKALIARARANARTQAAQLDTLFATQHRGDVSFIKTVHIGDDSFASVESDSRGHIVAYAVAYRAGRTFGNLLISIYGKPLTNPLHLANALARRQSALACY